MQKIEGNPSSGIITEIHPLHGLGGDGNDPIAFVRHDKGNIGWYPLPRDGNFESGQRIIVTPITEFVGQKGGSLTIYQITSEAKP